MTLRDSISPKLLDRRPAEVGRIKIGELGEEREKRDGSGTWRLPEKLSYFKITKRKRKDGDRDANFVKDEAVHEVVGEEPESLGVRLMFDRVEDNFYSSMWKFRGRDRVRECDGEVARDPRDPEDEFPCQHPDCRCRPYARLSLMLEASPTFGSVHVFRTTSWETVRNLATSLELLKGQFGFLAGLPLLLRLYPATDQYEEDGKQRTSTSYKVTLELRGTFEEAAQLARATYEQRLTDPTEAEALARAQREGLEELDEEEQGRIAEEFYPDARLPAGEEPDPEPEGIEAAAEELPDEDPEPLELDLEEEPEDDDASRVRWYNALRNELSNFQADEELLLPMMLAYCRLRDDQPDPVPGDRPLRDVAAVDLQRAVRDLRARGKEAVAEIYETMDRGTVQTSADVGEL